MEYKIKNNLKEDICMNVTLYTTGCPPCWRCGYYSTYPNTSNMISVISSAVMGTNPKSSNRLSPIIETPLSSGIDMRFS